MKNLNFFLKRYFLVATIFCISGTVLAQVEKEVTLTSSVNLSSALNSLGTDINTITKLTVINNTDGAALSSTDFATLNAMNALTYLDLSADKKTTTLTDRAFENNKTIETIKFPSNLNNVGAAVFNSSALKGVLTFPPSLTAAGSVVGRFNDCQGVTAFEFPENTVITAVDGVAFTDGGTTLLKYPCGKPDTEYVVPEGVIKIQDQSFYYNHILEILTLPATMQQIVGNSTFRESTAFKAVYVAEGNTLYASSSGILVDRAAKSLIYCPPRITEVIVDGTLVETTPAYRFFGGSPDVQKMVFTEGILSIADNGARLNNSENLADGSGALTEIYLPSTITTVGGNAFCRRGNVTQIVCRAVTPPVCEGNAFYDVGKSNTDPLNIYVPAASLSAYAGWGNLSAYGGVYKAFYNITLTDNDGTGGIQSSIGTDIAYAGATVTISAPEAPEGKSFDKWVVVSAGTVSFENDDMALASTTITMPAADVTLTPTYKTVVPNSEVEVTLSASVNLASALSLHDVNIITKLTVINNTDGAALSSSDFAMLNAMESLTMLDLSADEKTTTLTSNAFANNKTIETIKFPAKLNNIESGVFNSSVLMGILTFPSSLTSAPALLGRFNDCQGVTGYAFPDNTVITTVDGVIFVDGGRTLLKYPCGKPGAEYVVPEKVTKIQDQSFYYNHILETLILPSTLETFSNLGATFRYSTALKEILVAEGNTHFASSSGLLVDLATNKLVYCPPAITEVTVDGTLVESVTFDNNFRFFGEASGVEKFVFTEGVKIIGDNAIRLSASENVTDGSGALTKIDLPSTLTNIGSAAFCRRGNVTSIISRAITPPVCGANAFIQVGTNTTEPLNIYVPGVSLSSYAGWGNLSAYGGKYIPFYNVTLEDSDGTATIKSPLGTGIAYEGAIVEISVPEEINGEVFDKWVVTSTGTVIFENNDETKATTSITMPGADVTLTPTYREVISGDLSDYQTSWIANDGGKPANHIPHSMESIFVREDGIVASICGWDEGGTNVGLWKDGAVHSVPFESGTGSWGRNSGKAVVLDNSYVYQLMSFSGHAGDGGVSKNTNGLQRFPPKEAVWHFVARYRVSDGISSRFSTGYGPAENLMRIATHADQYLAGLAIRGNDLIVAVPGVPSQNIPDSLKIYDKTTMRTSATANGGFQITEGGVGYIVADNKGYVWMLQPDMKRIVAISLTSGAIRAQSTITIPEGVEAKSFSVDTYKNRILLPNSGKDLNVLIYTDIYSSPVQSSTFGVKGGIFVKSPKPLSEGGGEYLQGEVGHMRFPGPTGVGVDGNGNIYISNMFVGTSTAVLYSYKEETQELNWKLEGLSFTTTADFDLNNQNVFFTPDKIHEVDYSKLGGRLDRLVASSFDPFTFPNDFRNFPSPIICGVFNRKIDGHDFMYVTNMYSSILGVYRFDKEKHGYIAIPCNDIRKEYYWEDKNGDGQKTDDEINTFPTVVNTFSMYPDKDGNVWMTDAVSAPTNIQFKLFKVKRVNEKGILEYENPVSYKLPSYIIEAGRVMYDSERDELYVTCYTQANPNPNPSVWGRAGSTLLTYKNIKAKLANINNVPSEQWQYDKEMLIPVATVNEDLSAKSLAFAGDYFFVFLTRNGVINVYNRDTQEFVGEVSPGVEVGKTSGWTDITYALNARKNADGTYELLGEENGYAKVIHYMIRSLTPTGIEEEEGDSNTKFTVYPNPATTTINIDTNIAEYAVSLISVDGRKVIQRKMANSNSIDISNVPKGIYILEVTTPNERVSKKIILK